MPSPVGHALAGMTAGVLIDRPSRWSIPAVALFGVAGMFPDIDLLFGIHSGPTHGIGAAVIAGALAWLISRRILFGVATAAAYSTHTLLDWLGSDTSAPIGIMALWPFSRAYFESSLHLFMAITRRYWLPEFWTHNVKAIAREFLILLPPLLLSLRLRLKRGHSIGTGKGDRRD